MTFTIIGRCPETRQLGVCLATSPLGVASRCPAVRRGVAAISSQCFSNWRLGLIGLDLAERGVAAEQVIAALRASDAYFDDYRQVGIVTADGGAAAHSPAKGKDFTGHRLGEGFVAMGNGVAGSRVIDAIHDSFAGSAGLSLPERLMLAIEAGFAAGGEPIGQKSAGLLVSAPEYDRPLVDLRIDMASPLPSEGGDAVRDLRRVFDAYKPLIPYYADYWLDHPEVSAAEYAGRPGRGVGHGVTGAALRANEGETSSPQDVRAHARSTRRPVPAPTRSACQRGLSFFGVRVRLRGPKRFGQGLQGRGDESGHAHPRLDYDERDGMRRSRVIATAMLLVGLALSPRAQAAMFRWASDGDVSSLDPYSRNETFQLTFLQNIYDPLLRRDRDLKLEPALATGWERTSPVIWRFHLRQGVKFQGGEPFTADDVVFSYRRATGPTSNIASFFTTVKEVRKIDDHTVDFELIHADPVFLQGITGWVIMSRAWCEAHGATQAVDLTTKTENFASRNANGTGPYRLDSREPDRRTTLKASEAWWDRRPGNVTEARFDVLGNPATRVAALISGETDMLYSVPSQAVARLKQTDGVLVAEGPEFRTLYLGFDQARDALLKSDVTGKNPFRDRRVRLAMYQAIDIAAIRDRVMLGQSHPTGLIYGPGVNGYTVESDTRYPFDPGAARRLLAEAGYPDGFGVTLDCTNDRYINDGAICQAVTNMLARVGIKVTLNAESKLKFFGEISPPKYATSFFMLGYTPSSYDAQNPLSYLLGTRGPARGEFNIGGYSNPAFDALLDEIAVESNEHDRNARIVAASRIIQEDVAVIPLHQQVVIWAARANIDLRQLPDNTFPLRFVTVK